MPRPFIHPDFLLTTPQAQRLFHEFAENLPIIDYHCHLPPVQAATNHRFRNLAEIWLGGDHYKWRGMRTNGVDERFCTGDASDREKFQKWAETVPKCLRNPLYHWTHLELNRPFGINDVLLGPDTAQQVWDRANALLATEAFRPWGIMKQMRVEAVCTTDDPVDDLAHHKTLAASACPARVLPTWRPDKALKVADAAFWNSWVDRLAAAAGMAVKTYDDLLAALQKQHDVFHAAGCRLSDYGLDRCFAAVFSPAGVRAACAKLRGGAALTPDEAEVLASSLQADLARMDHASDWTMQLHLGAMRNNNSRLFARLGPDTGFDSIGDLPQGAALSRFLDRLDGDDRLPRTILYNLNPADNEVLATMCGNFQDGSRPGKIQYGSGWWFLDQWDGMTRHIEALSQLGLLSRFVGMLTDSRSFLSYTRHEYFRRLVCEILGRDMARGAIPEDYDLVGNMVADVSYRNARDYFRFHEVTIAAG